MRRNKVTKVCNFSRFVAGVAFHTCVALGRGRIATPAVLVTFATKSNASAAWQKIYARTKAKILRLVTLAQNDRTIICVVSQQADNIRPYAVFGMFWDVQEAVPYVVIQKYISSINFNLSNGLYNTSKYKSQAAFCGLALTVLLTPEKVRISL